MENSEIVKTKNGFDEVIEGLQLIPNAETVRRVQELLCELPDEIRPHALPIFNLLNRIRGLIVNLSVGTGKRAFCERFIEYGLYDEAISYVLKFLQKRGYEAECVFVAGPYNYTIKVSWEIIQSDP